MKDEDKSKEQLISELIVLRRQVRELKNLVRMSCNVHNPAQGTKGQKKSTGTGAEKFRDIFEKSFVGIFQTTPEGRCITVNNAFAKNLRVQFTGRDNQHRARYWKTALCQY